jgi:acyl-CoA hydrolase
MTEIVLPEDSNSRGSIFGGRVLSLVDKCAAAVALRHARCEVSTVQLDSVDFRKPVKVGDILILGGRINAAFGSSMEVEVEVRSENPWTGQQQLTTRAFVTMVAVGSDGRPTPVPPLRLRTPSERRRAAEAARRRRRRLLDRRRQPL